MHTRIIYRPNSDHARAVEEFCREYQYRTGRTIETVNPDTRAGADYCAAYDITAYPTLLVTRHDGSVQFVSRGLPLPLINEVEYYDQS